MHRLLSTWRPSLAGSSPETVRRSLTDALSALDAASDALRSIEVHPRDYIDRMPALRVEQARRREMIETVDGYALEIEDAVITIEDHIAEQESTR